MNRNSEKPPLIAHIIYRLDIGGMENGLVNLLNNIPEESYRHAIICLTEHTKFRERIRNKNIQLFSVHKCEGKDLWHYYRVWKILRKLQPYIVHTRNLASIESQIPAFLSMVNNRIHGEHGWDVGDLHGNSRKNRTIRKFCKPYIKHYIALSKHIQSYLSEQIGVSSKKISQIYNGVDTKLFRPATNGREKLPNASFAPDNAIVIGTVGRMQDVKDQLTLLRAFKILLKSLPDSSEKPRLVLIGDGPLRSQVGKLANETGIADIVWLAGERDDIPNIMRCFDLFVLPSLAEGISNTILESMSCGLPVVATAVGGNPELVIDGVTGKLVPAANPEAMGSALYQYIQQPDMMREHGSAGRKRVEKQFSLTKMVDAYIKVYDSFS